MKKAILFLIILIFISIKINSQELFGNYFDSFGSNIRINDDSTYNYTFRFDVMSS